MTILFPPRRPAFCRKLSRGLRFPQNPPLLPPNKQGTEKYLIPSQPEPGACARDDDTLPRGNTDGEKQVVHRLQPAEGERLGDQDRP